MGAVGSYSNSLNFTSDLLSTMITNTEAAKSSIMDANVAQEQMACVPGCRSCSKRPRPH